MNIWNELNHNERNRAEDFLRLREQFCVSAISRFRGGAVNNAWAVFDHPVDGRSGGREVSALLLYGKRLLYPVFHFSEDKCDEFKTKGMSLPRFFLSHLRNDSLHAIQGIADDVDILEGTMKKNNIVMSAKYDYDLLSLDYKGADFTIRHPPGLVIRRAMTDDAAALFPLQAAYEKEEVLPPGAEFNPAACLRSLEALIAEKMILAAELEGSLVGKININAVSYNYFQIGGVYVLPEYRSRGIARAMTAVLLRELASEKNHFSLFVKKTNIPARHAYGSLGFKKIADYRISYFS